MFGQSLLLGTGISGISTGVYAAFTYDKNDLKDRKNEYLAIFSIILVISSLILFIFHGNSESLMKVPDISKHTSSPIGGGKPPF